ncbi:YeeE/YedE family protein [Acuticoccus sp. M5D2P5]|uniref:YeeE/YedE family protein n=1 Tax=Acuticoccus kalidii TaxID=2910977 RepID=UPI001F46DFFE|nr:YeeE/YedE family protein [Acuticoccus kalidii]MCF3935415.1 YeeE/YedE family protein [Acuticoccus kalidii]
MSASQPPHPQRVLAIGAACVLAIIAVLAAVTERPYLGLATLVGGLAGFSLYHAAFGFTAGWRRFIRERRGGGLRMQLILVGMTTIFAIPIIHYGDAVGIQASGFVFPFGLAVIIGSFMFGFGMQLGGGCGSGTLFTVGGGSTRMLITLAFFIAGGLAATHNFAFWQSLPALPSVGFASTSLGPMGAIVVTIAALSLLYAIIARAERQRHGDLDNGKAMGSLLYGPWSLWAGAIGLTIVGVLTLLVLGRPWGITSGLTLWGAQIANAVGVPIVDWPYWTYAMGQVDASILASGTSVMNLGLIVGACLAATLAGRFAPKLNLSGRDIATAIIGGFLMGYGARIAFGCNIGALLSGIASGSLHGWGWFLFAFLGSIAGVRIREWIGMDPPREPVAPRHAVGAQS